MWRVVKRTPNVLISVAVLAYALLTSSAMGERKPVIIAMKTLSARVRFVLTTTAKSQRATYPPQPS